MKAPGPAEILRRWDNLLLQFLMPQFFQKLSPWWRYGLAAAIAVAATALRWAVVPWMGVVSPYNIALVAIITATLLLGFWAGVLCMVLADVGAEIFVVGSLPTMFTTVTLSRLGTAIAVGAFACYLLHAFRAAQARSNRCEVRLRDGEKEQRRQRRFLECVIANAGSCIFVLKGGELRHVMVNRTFENATGGMKVIGRTFREVFPQVEAGVEACIRQVMETGDPWIVNACRIPTPRIPDATWQGQVVRLPLLDEEEPSVLVVAWDVTERVRVEEALRQHEELLRALTDNSPDAIYVKDAQSRWLMANPAVLRIVGRTAAQALGKTDLELYADPEIGRAILENDRRIMAQGASESFEEIADTPEGRRVFQSIKAARRDAWGNIIEIIGISRDITDRKHAQEKLQTAMQRFYSVLSSLYAGVVLISDIGRVEFINQAMCDLFGLKESPEELMALDSAVVSERVKNACLHPEQEFARIQEIVRAGKPVMGQEIALRDGRTCLRDFIPISIDGKSHGRLWHHLDITKIKEGEKQLQAEKDFSMGIIQGTPAIICGIGPDGTTNFINPAGEKITGYRAEQLIGKNWWDLFYPGDEYRQVEQLFRDFSKGEVRDYEMTLTTSDGSKRTISWNSLLTRDDAGNILQAIGFGNDVTQRRLAEQLLRQRTEELQAANQKLKGTANALAHSNQELKQFAYAASHDLQEPLRVVSQFLKLLRERYALQLDAKANEYIGYSVDGAERMSILIRDLLEYSRVGRKGQPLRPASAGRALDGAVANLRGAIQEAGAEVTHDALPVVLGDSTQLMQLLQNLIGNAVKFRRPGRSCEVHVSVQKKGGFWEFSVRDNGIGIDPAQLDRVFMVFQRLHTQEEYPGTGIGLAICKKIVERHGGRIWVESQPGEGSAFFFTLQPAEAPQGSLMFSSP